MKRAFTLVELLVVIGIIGILAGVLIASFGGATDSARAAQCLSNMRSLAQGVNAYAMEHGFYPFAGSAEVVDIDESSGKEYYVEKRGWISWLSKDSYRDSEGRARSASHRSNSQLPFYGNGNIDDETFAITNGAAWIASGRHRSIYTCPTHALYRKNHRMSEPLWSYVMNARFFWDSKKGSGPIGTSRAMCGVRYGTLAKADKTLLFAELPTIDPTGGQDFGEDKSGTSSDCVLQYQQVSSTSGGKGAFSSSGGEAESIGFVHKLGKRKYCAHVAFADGHTEKLSWSDGGIDVRKLTAYLCRGWDVTFDTKKGWSLAQGADRAD